MKLLSMMLLLLTCTVTAGELKPMPLSPAAEVVRAEFGMLQNGQFVVTDQVPLVVGQSYGWRMLLKTNKLKVKWREQFILPTAPVTWGIEGVKGTNEISSDKRVSVTEREVTLENGLIFNAWQVAEGDPKGRYMLRVSVDNQPERVFVFDLVAPEKKRR